ncbi:prolyl 4-hydroxylase subunit alpha-2-like [Paramacrobiotus metropolitanus]|uniref:prolyl 4-hydroxylase subunit alpha-2-like n=1 Tax=Paramacrobiotus metropolitanus TaxID=2943436 RepID=UPI0024461C3D|nr:prolyl 4-hydroxylase subunit alpha-2-like [Paramacrobiotus metropolitanus]
MLVSSILWGFFALSSYNVLAEVFLSMAEVETLITTEKMLLDVLKNHLHQEKLRLTKAQGYRELVRDLAQAKSEESHLHRIKIDQCLKHRVDIFNNITDVLSQETFAEQNRSILGLRISRAFPDKTDMEGIADAFAMLQMIYKLHPRDIAKGRIPETRRTMPFTSEEAAIIGYNQIKNKLFNSGSAWLEMALEIHRNEKTKTAQISDVLHWLQYAVYHETNNVVRAREILQKIHEIQPDYPGLEKKFTHYFEHIRRLKSGQIFQMYIAPTATQAYNSDIAAVIEDPEFPDTQAYGALCRGEKRMHALDKRKLNCFYQTHGDPYLLIQPIKVEKVYIDPEILILHDIILDSQIIRLREIGYHHLVRGRIVDENNPNGTEFENALVTKDRIAKIAFLDPALDPVIPTVNRYIGYATNLDHAVAEDLQVNNYGIGGHFAPHHDYFGNIKNPDAVTDEEWGDRIATLLIYMTNVEAGGATVFPLLNLTLFPEKGSAAFWYNKFKDGFPDWRTLHAGCPVLSGNKWVSNKWFRERGQDRRRPCGLQRDGFGDLDGVLTLQEPLQVL